MAFFSIRQVALRGISAAVPKNSASNLELEGFEKEELDKLVSTLGIEQRRVALKDLCASDLCVAAANALIEKLGWERNDIEALFFVTQTPDHSLPGTSMHIQQRLGLPKSCASYDINQGCAGYVYGLSLISALMSAGGLKKGLLLAGDTITRNISPFDRSLIPLFSDCGTATAVELDEDTEKWHFNTSSEGQDYEAIIIREGGARMPFDDCSLVYEEQEGGVRRKGVHLAMKGLDVFNFSLRKVVPNVEELLQRAGCTVGDIDQFVFHQANRLILESISKKLGVGTDKVPSSLKHYGNTSGASIPLTLVSALGSSGQIADGRMLLSGFGVGLSLASAIVNFKGVICPEIIEL